MPLFPSRKKQEEKPLQRVTTARSTHDKQVAESVEAGLYPTRVASRKGVKLFQYLVKVAIVAFIGVILLSASGILDPIRKFLQPVQGGTGTLIVTSDYIRANVSVDGKVLGQTPFTGESISAGKHTLKVSAVDNTNNYFKESEIQVEVNIGNTTIVRANPAPTESLLSYTIISSQNRSAGDAQLIVKALPQGVSVMIDGTKVGATPYITENLTAGTHQLLLEKTGFKPVLVDITVVDDKVVTLDAKLYQYQVNLER